MYFVYIDDSQEDKHRIFSAICVPTKKWNEIFTQIKLWRKHLKDNDGIFMHTELHATKFVGGRGRVGNRVVTKHRRAQILHGSLGMLSNLPDVRVFNACFDNKDTNQAFSNLLNRINKTMGVWEDQAHLICDEGKEAIYTKLVRRMRVYNPIPSRFGIWTGTGKTHKNIPLDQIIEDPQFKRSGTSYFIQMADFIAYALLRKEKPLASKNVYGIHKSFDQIAPICVTEATQYDPLGIIRNW